MAWTIGVDVGGTFTDFFAIDDATGKECIWKRPSTPQKPAEAIVSGVKEMAAAYQIPFDQITRLAHGTTVATNALIQRKGGSVALITTRGFRDLVEIGRQIRPHLYDLHRDYPAPLVRRDRRLEVRERIDASGKVHTPLDARELDHAISAIREMNVDAVAVCFLFAFINPTHENEVAARIRRELPDIEVSTSAGVQPEFREYERFTTTIINAYLQPVLSEYMDSLQADLAALLPKASVGVNQSSGGLMTIPRTKSFPVRTALSGPAAGVVGALHVASTVGKRNVLTIDVGGTSADVAMINDGKFNSSYGRDVDGFPIRLPMVDIQTIGAGGGSIAWFDKDGLLKMGPQSAGARPGPACYQLGGAEATLSDANLVLGRLSPSLLNGAMKLNVALALNAVERIAKPMKKSVEETAEGMIAVSVSNMVRAIRSLSVERGYDPRDFVLMPFGGAGPMHARDIAVAMSMREIVIPKSPGIVCAQGLVISDLKEDFIAGARAAIDDITPSIVDEKIADLKKRALAWATSEDVPANKLAADLSFDMRYIGQNFELSVPIFSGFILSLPAVPKAPSLKRLFFEAHDRAYSFHDEQAKIELMNVRLTVRTTLAAATGSKKTNSSRKDPTPVGERQVFFTAHRAENVPVYRREDLPPGGKLVGPAVIDQVDTSTPIFPGDVVTIHESGHLIIEVAQS